MTDFRWRRLPIIFFLNVTVASLQTTHIVRWFDDHHIDSFVFTSHNSNSFSFRKTHNHIKCESVYDSIKKIDHFRIFIHPNDRSLRYYVLILFATEARLFLCPWIKFSIHFSSSVQKKAKIHHCAFLWIEIVLFISTVKHSSE